MKNWPKLRQNFLFKYERKLHLFYILFSFDFSSYNEFDENPRETGQYGEENSSLELVPVPHRPKEYSANIVWF